MSKSKETSASTEPRHFVKHSTMMLRITLRFSITMNQASARVAIPKFLSLRELRQTGRSTEIRDDPENAFGLGLRRCANRWFSLLKNAGRESNLISKTTLGYLFELQSGDAPAGTATGCLCQESQCSVTRSWDTGIHLF